MVPLLPTTGPSLKEKTTAGHRAHFLTCPDYTMFTPCQASGLMGPAHPPGNRAPSPRALLPNDCHMHITTARELFRAVPQDPAPGPFCAARHISALSFWAGAATPPDERTDARRADAV